MARVRQARSSRVDRLHRTLDVPQADRLGNVRQLVAAIRHGIDHAATLLELLDVDHRHFLYYRQAAVILGVVEFNARGELGLLLVEHDHTFGHALQDRLALAGFFALLRKQLRHAQALIGDE